MAHLTAAQLQTLKSDILGDGALNAFPNTPDGNSEIAKAYNLTASPDFWTWKASLTEGECVNGVSVDGTTFAWSGAGGFIARSVGEQTAWARMFGISGAVIPSLANVRQAFADIFSGAGVSAVANRAHLLAIARRKAKRWEKLFATGTGSTGSPATLGVGPNGETLEGTLDYTHVESARNLP